MAKKILIIGVALVMCFGLFAGCDDKMTSHERIENITGMTIPQNAEQEFYYWDMDFQGDYRLYAVFKFEEEPMDFLKEYGFEEIENGYSAKDLSSRFNKDIREYNSSFDSKHYMDKVIKDINDREGSGHAMYFPEELILICIMLG